MRTKDARPRHALRPATAFRRPPIGPVALRRPRRACCAKRAGAPMLIYLPIAEVSVNAFLLLGLGGAVGLLSGLFGVGGGFLMTPLLIFIGIPPAVAVATQTAQIVAGATTSAFASVRRNALDFKLGT